VEPDQALRLDHRPHPCHQYALPITTVQVPEFLLLDLSPDDRWCCCHGWMIATRSDVSAFA
jgi:hypothetical protein